jgi:hypothetical protein
MKKYNLILLGLILGVNGGLLAGASVGGGNYGPPSSKKVNERVLYADLEKALNSLDTRSMQAKGLPINLVLRLIEKLAKSSAHEFGSMLHNDQALRIVRRMLHKIVTAMHKKLVPTQQNISKEDMALQLVRGTMQALVDLKADKIEKAEFVQKSFILGLCMLKLVIDMEKEVGISPF